MTNHDQEFEALCNIAEELVAMDRRAMHNGECLDFETLDQIVGLAKQVLGKRAVEMIHHAVDEEILGV